MGTQSFIPPVKQPKDFSRMETLSMEQVVSNKGGYIALTLKEQLLNACTCRAGTNAAGST